jgi:hypothetical protein
MSLLVGVWHPWWHGVGLLLCAWAGTDTPPGWRTEIAYEAGGKLGGCAVGDLVPDRPGAEIAVVAAGGEVLLVSRSAETWSGKRIATTKGEMIQCAAGDLDPALPGDELVAVGMLAGSEEDGGAGAAYLIAREGEGFQLKLLFEDRALIHGVCIGEMDSSRPGPEILAVGFSNEATCLSRGTDGAGWKNERAATLPGPGKNAVAFRKGAAIACADGSIVYVEKRDGAWHSETILRREAGQARIGTDGMRLVVAGDDGKLGLVEGNAWREVYASPSKLRGAVLTDLDPDHPGAEAATAGYERELIVLTSEGTSWRSTVLFQDEDRFHHLTCGDVDERAKGPELVACGFSGRVIVARRE